MIFQDKTDYVGMYVLKDDTYMHVESMSGRTLRGAMVGKNSFMRSGEMGSRGVKVVTQDDWHKAIRDLKSDFEVFVSKNIRGEGGLLFQEFREKMANVAYIKMANLIMKVSELHYISSEEYEIVGDVVYNNQYDGYIENTSVYISPRHLDRIIPTNRENWARALRLMANNVRNKYYKQKEKLNAKNQDK